MRAWFQRDDTPLGAKMMLTNKQIQPIIDDIADAIREERERCAKIAEGLLPEATDPEGEYIAERIAAAIRSTDTRG
jgi:hypothetical protein